MRTFFLLFLKPSIDQRFIVVCNFLFLRLIFLLPLFFSELRFTSFFLGLQFVIIGLVRLKTLPLDLSYLVISCSVRKCSSHKICLRSFRAWLGTFCPLLNFLSFYDFLNFLLFCFNLRSATLHCKTHIKIVISNKFGNYISYFINF